MLYVFSFMVYAQDKLLFLPYNHAATICPVEQTTRLLEPAAPSFTDADCKLLTVKDINPQANNIWVKINFDVPKKWQQVKPPLGFYISGKAASRVYLNSQLLGTNGQPETTLASAHTDEVAGKMDSVFYVPNKLIKLKNNELIMHLSGRNSIIELDSPMHLLTLGPFGSPKRFIQNYSEVGLILVGAFAVGTLYFLVLSFGNRDAGTYRIFTALCLIAACQLTAEISRKLFDYSYQWHDIRLVVITALSFIFGTLVLLYSARKLAGKHAVHWVYIGVLLSAITLIFAPGFDTKTTAGIFIPLLVSLVLLLYYWINTKNTQTLRWLLFQFAVVVTIVISAASFHEIVHFVIIGLLLSYLFVQQASDVRQQQKMLHQEQTRLAKLEYKLAQNTQLNAPTKLEISVAGKTEYLNATDIAYCKAAGDYVELYLNDQSEKLFSGSLKHLESLLPETFLRVHRSYLVNLAEVVSLTSNLNQEGNMSELTLSSNQTVPVSRRLLPTVKDTLKQQI